MGEMESKTIKTVLVADDDPSIGKLFEMALSKQNIKVTVVRDGDEALEAIRNNDYDLAFIDMEMPRVDGIEAIAIMKRKKPKMKIYAISGGGVLLKESYLELADMVGADEILVKPFSLRKIARLVKNS